MARSIPTFPTTPNDPLTGKVGRPLLGLVARPASLRHQSVEMRRPVRTLRWKPGFHLSFIIRLRSVAVSASLMDFRNASLSDLSGLQRPSAFEWETGCCSSIRQMIRSSSPLRNG